MLIALPGERLACHCGRRGSVCHGEDSQMALATMRYDRESPGELIHIDTRKIGRTDGIGHRISGDRTGQSNKHGIGWEYVPVAIDDASRLATAAPR